MIVTNIIDSDNGLQVQLYVQRMREVISQQVVIDAVNVSSVNWFCSCFSGISCTLIYANVGLFGMWFVYCSATYMFCLVD